MAGVTCLVPLGVRASTIVHGMYRLAVDYDSFAHTASIDFWHYQDIPAIWNERYCAVAAQLIILWFHLWPDWRRNADHNMPALNPCHNISPSVTSSISKPERIPLTRTRRPISERSPRGRSSRHCPPPSARMNGYMVPSSKKPSIVCVVPRGITNNYTNFERWKPQNMCAFYIYNLLLIYQHPILLL